MQILIVVTHLLGTGHLKRAINLAQAFADADHAATVVSGGFPVEYFGTEGVSIIQLPPLGSDGTQFTRLLKSDGAIADADFLSSRRKALCELVHQIQPAIVITELFPFGRRVLRDEFLALLEALKSLPTKPLVLSSVRDILSAPSTEEKARNTEALINSYYAGVLVHSDSNSTKLDLSWPVSDTLQPKLHYTGYVSQAVATSQSMSELTGEIVVSAGGGTVGRNLFDTAVRAAQLSKTMRWRVLVGGDDAQQEILRLQQLAALTPGWSDNLTIEPVRPDFRQLLKTARCSVSLCGYNTAVDLLQTGTPGVFIPFDEGGELEQVLRATSLSKLPSFEMLLARYLTPERLLESIESLGCVNTGTRPTLRFDGAQESVRIAVNMVEKQTRNGNANV